VGTSGFRWGTCNPGGLYGPCNGGNNSFFWSSEDGGSLSIIASSSLAAGQWYHLAITYTGTSAILYVNGQPAGSGTGAILSSTNNLALGPNFGYKKWLGLMDDFRIYNRTLSQAEIQRIYIGTE
jgi:hypothetical protein